MMIVCLLYINLLLLWGDTCNALPSIEKYGYIWTLSLSNISHTMACANNGLKPSSSYDFIPWNRTIMEDIVTSFNRDVIKTGYGINGCCVPGLWCDQSVCFTQSLSPHYFNYQGSQDIAAYTVYTCVGSPVDDTVSISSVTLNGGQLTISGHNYGLNDTLIDTTIGGIPCRNKEICSSVCQVCDDYNCPKDSVCLSVGSTRSCLMYCGGPADSSCPCDTTCQHVNVYTGQDSFVSAHFCAPKNLDCGSYRSSHSSQVRCETHRSYSWTSDSTGPQSLNVAIAVSQNSAIVSHTQNMEACTSDMNCHDDSMYTSDTCEYGSCSYEPYTQSLDEPSGQMSTPFGSVYPAITERSTPFTYVTFIADDMISEQDLFESTVRLTGKLSSVSDVDDFPVEYMPLNFPFTFFGNTVNDIGINPNGLISLPPYVPCFALAGTLNCPVFGTDTNVISIWGSDFDLRLGGQDSTVHVLEQSRSNELYFNDVYGINADGFHVLYSFVYKYVQGSARDSPSNPVTFSLSMYEDGSIRLRYHTAHATHASTDVYGIWGSRASTSDETGSRYHEESLPKDVVSSGTDVTFCAITTMSCAPETSAREGSSVTVTLLGDAPSCTALGEAGLLTYCVWMGGGDGMVTTPTYIQSSNGTSLLCPVPSLNVSDHSLVSLDISYNATRDVLYSTVSDGQKSLFTKSYDTSTGEITNGHVMFRYISAVADEVEYGCNPLQSSPSVCDSCLVCGGNSSTVDCNGECFGMAYIDSCGVCSGGSTGLSPGASCDLSGVSDDWNNSNILDTVSKTILLLTMMVCMTFIFSACMRVIRASFIVGRGDDLTDENVFGGPAYPLRRGNGLSRFEIDALGQMEYSAGTKLNSSHQHCTDIETSLTFGNDAPLIDFTVECAICLNDLNEGDMCRQLPCDHLFHRDCIDQWFTLSVACPMCKRNIRAILHGDDTSTTSSSASSFPSRRTDTSPSTGNPLPTISPSPSVVSSENVELNPIVELAPRNTENVTSPDTNAASETSGYSHVPNSEE